MESSSREEEKDPDEGERVLNFLGIVPKVAKVSFLYIAFSALLERLFTFDFSFPRIGGILVFVGMCYGLSATSKSPRPIKRENYLKVDVTQLLDTQYIRFGGS